MSGLAEKCEVEEALGVKMPDGDYNSIGGFMLLTIDRIPRVGEACIVETAAERIRLEISKVDERRVLQIEAFRQRKEMGEDEDLLLSLSHKSHHVPSRVRLRLSLPCDVQAQCCMRLACSNLLSTPISLCRTQRRIKSFSLK